MTGQVDVAQLQGCDTGLNVPEPRDNMPDHKISARDHTPDVTLFTNLSYVDKF